MERLELEIRTELQQAIQLIQQLIGRVEELEARMKAAGAAADQTKTKIEGAGQKSTESLNKATGATEKFQEQLKQSQARIDAVKQKIDEKKASIDKMDNSLTAVTGNVANFVKAWIGLDVIVRLISAVDDRLKSVVESTLKLAQGQLAQAMMVGPVMESFNLYPKGREGEQEAIRMMNAMAERTGMRGDQAARFLGSMAVSINNDPKRTGELDRIAMLASRSGLTGTYDDLRSIFSKNEKLLPVDEINRRAAAIQYGLLASGKSDPAGFLKGLGTVVSQRQASGGSFDKAFGDYLAMTNIIPQGKEAAQQATMVMRALAGEEPQARDKLTAIYAEQGLLQYSAMTDDELEKFIATDGGEAAQSINKLRKSIPFRQNAIALEEREHRSRANRTSVDDQQFAERKAKSLLEIENLKIDDRQKTAALRESVNAERRARAFAGLPIDQRMDIGLSALAAAGGDPLKMDEFSRALGGQQFRAEAVRRLASAVDERKVHAEAARAGRYLPQLKAAEQGFVQTSPARANIVAARSREVENASSTFGGQLFNEFSESMESRYKSFASTDSPLATDMRSEDLYVNKDNLPPLYGRVWGAGRGGMSTFTKGGRRAAFEAREAVRFIKHTEDRYRKAGNHQAADRLRALGIRAESEFFYKVGGTWTNTQVQAELRSIFEEIGNIQEGERLRGNLPTSPTGDIPTGETIAPTSSGPVGMSGSSYQINVGAYYGHSEQLWDLPGRLEGSA